MKLYEGIIRTSWLTLVVAGFSCDPENETALNNEQMKVQAEQAARLSGEMITASHDAMEVTTAAIESEGVGNGRLGMQAGKGSHPNLDCNPSISASYSVDNSNPDISIFKGLFTIDYGDGSQCADSTEVRKGKIIDSVTFVLHHKDTVFYELTQAVTFQGYQKDSVMIDGSFRSHSTSNGVTVLTIAGATLNYLDGTSVTLDGSLTSTYDTGGTWKKSDDTRVVTGSISGTNREGVNFESEITEPVLFDFSCHRHVAVDGVIETTVGTVTSVLDFGDGACNKIYTVTTAGVTTEYKFHSHHAD